VGVRVEAVREREEAASRAEEALLTCMLQLEVEKYMNRGWRASRVHSHIHLHSRTAAHFVTYIVYTRGDRRGDCRGDCRGDDRSDSRGDDRPVYTA